MAPLVKNTIFSRSFRRNGGAAHMFLQDQVWWYKTVILALRKLMQEDHEFKVSPSHTVISCLKPPLYQMWDVSLACRLNTTYASG